jgi:hypothetical protein
VIFTRAAREPDPNKGFGPLPIKAEHTWSTYVSLDKILLHLKYTNASINNTTVFIYNLGSVFFEGLKMTQ